MTGEACWPRFTVAEIDTALLSLPERERAVLMAHRIRRMTNAEIAKACRTDIADIECNLAAALLRLKQAFDRLAEERAGDP